MGAALADAVGPQVDLDYPRKDGSTLREHLQSWSRQSGKWDERLNPPVIPERMAYLWEWFWQIIEGRGDQGFWVTLEAWKQATGNELTWVEVDTLRQMATEYDKAVGKKIKEK
jgi:hypothetical protein